MRQLKATDVGSAERLARRTTRQPITDGIRTRIKPRDTNNFPRLIISSIIDSLSEIDIIEDYSSRSNINLVKDPIRANAVFPEALKASLEPQTQVWVRRELLDPLPDALLDVARELLEPFEECV